MIYIIVHNPEKVKRLFEKNIIFLEKRGGYRICSDLISEREGEGFGKTFPEI